MNGPTQTNRDSHVMLGNPVSPSAPHKTQNFSQFFPNQLSENEIRNILTIMSSEKHFRMACCGCCMDPVLCCYVACCPCFAFYEAAENIGSDKGFIYLIATLLGFGCCALGDLTNDVAEKAGVEMTFPCAMVYALFDGCFCYSCRSVYESRLIKKEAAPDGLTMDRK
mmetsp:Transcript_19133/g.44578  ORF Transcript_19133/g.44578 Transcript_19133/m.44578 type:complete len:167 (+) Transcript_19133:290-790(+)